ncbi:MAG: methylcrotonoyl-CoA carboxylase [Candidatus Marinimicrobia bacterium]|nr:methylcrotonoyl-CoA carboxylase [Candidatus Neomarinimicrobiota bacterium]
MSKIFKSKILNINNENLRNNFNNMIKNFNNQIDLIKNSGGKAAIQKQHDKGRLTARERISNLIDENTYFLELGKFAGFEMYKEYGGCPAGGLITGIAVVNGLNFMVIANDATVKAGAYFEVTLKKTLRAQEIAYKNNLPIIYLVDSAGVFLPLQDQVFPDEGHFGKIFYNNARLSANGNIQIASVMGPCVAGGAYLPVMCDKYVMTKGSSMFLAGPALVKAAVGQEIDAESLGGSKTHSRISGIVDYEVENDYDALIKIKDIISSININQNNTYNEFIEPSLNFEDIYNYFDVTNNSQYDVKELIARLVDNSEFIEFKENYGKTIVCLNAKIGGHKVGIVANQKIVIKTEDNQLQLGGVIYNDSSDKASRFIMNCNQDKIPIIFIHDVNGFMVGKHAEWSGIAKDGAKMVNAVSNSIVPKITLIIGGSYGAGNYAMSGKAYDPSFIFAWPNAKIAVMGGDQAAKTLTSLKVSKLGSISDEEKEKIYKKIKSRYDIQSDIRYGAARLWVDEIIEPKDTRSILIKSLCIVNNTSYINNRPNYGVFQV